MILQKYKIWRVYGKIRESSRRVLFLADIGSSIYNNLQSGSSSWITDSAVDITYSSLKYGVSALCMFITGVVWIVGIGLCLLGDYIMKKTGFVNTAKQWAADIGDDTADGWNSFWSFNWI